MKLIADIFFGTLALNVALISIPPMLDGDLEYLALFAINGAAATIILVPVFRFVWRLLLRR